ncbi:UvrD-helicase domain-containing protein [Microbulbifer sp. ZKSA004]|uniref:UvrD-helicase domain-containing protein n=1 Tax=Microbulbifer sp. ZKSA004 TaxID=3243389 RepID=UPI004039B16C
MFVWGEGELNSEQSQAILDPRSVFLVACPGSGKTRTLTYKIAYELARLRESKKFVVAITYTNRAADEINERIEALGISTDRLWIGTIHSFCLEWILKPYGIYHDYLTRGYSVIDSHESELILTELCAKYAHQRPRVTFWDCGYYFVPEGYVRSCNESSKFDVIDRVLSEYFEILKSRRQIDYELILLFSFQLMESKSEISSVLSAMFSYILVDEYQDTKKIQYSIISSILRAGEGSTRTFIVGDPNQAIFQSLGGFAIDVNDFRSLTGVEISERELSRNYRSSRRIVDYFSHFKVFDSDIVSALEGDEQGSVISYENAIHKDDLEDELIRLIRFNIEDRGVPQTELCILAPQWPYLASMTRKLVSSLPEYQFNGPGMVPFSRDIENFWFKLSKIALTRSSPDIYVRRLRWASEVLRDIELAGVNVDSITPKYILRTSNTIEIDEENGLHFLDKFFHALFELLGIDAMSFPMLKVHYEAFFESSASRIERLEREGAAFISHIDTFKKVFQPRQGITISTIHGVKGAEFDSVIAYALLEGMVPHFSDPYGEESAKKLLYVIGSRARKNLHLVSELGRIRFRREEYRPTTVLSSYSFDYDNL